MVVLLAAIAAALTLTLAGCADQNQPARPSHTTTISDHNNGEPYYWHGTIDGIECVIAGSGDNAISCDWHGRVRG